MNTRIKTSSVMGLYNFPSFDSVGSYSAVVRSLRSREAISGPTVDLLVVDVEESIFLEVFGRNVIF